MDINEAKDYLENRINPNMVGTVLRAAEEEGEKHALPSGGEVGDVLKKTTDGAEWAEETKELPNGGNKDDVLTKTESGVEWKAPSGAVTPFIVTVNYDNRTIDKTNAEIETALNQNIPIFCKMKLGIHTVTAQLEYNWSDQKVTITGFWRRDDGFIMYAYSVYRVRTNAISAQSKEISMS